MAAGQRVVCATVEAAIKITHTTSCRATFGIRHWALGNTHTRICRLSVRVHKLSAGIGSTISIFSQAKMLSRGRGASLLISYAATTIQAPFHYTPARSACLLCSLFLPACSACPALPCLLCSACPPWGHFISCLSR